MTSSANTKKCGICSRVAVGRDQPLFTADCSDAFHMSCFSVYVSSVSGNLICPVCSATWNNHLLRNPNPNPNPIRSPPLRYHPYRPRSHPNPLDPLCFNDDEPLPNADAKPHDLMLTDSLAAADDLHKVEINTIPERNAVPASLSVPQFTVVVGLKAPSLSPSQRAPIDIVAVLDVSGSMKGKKLDLVKRAMRFVIDNLGDSDRLSVVADRI